MSLAIRAAVRPDAELIVAFIAELAAYEKLSHEAKASIGDIERDLFGATPRIFCEIAEWDGVPVGFILWFYNYSTFQGRQGIWLEDLFVRTDHRGLGIGKALLKHLARRCVAEQLGRLEWWVLDWNSPSIDFYRSQGAILQDEWTKCRVEGDGLALLAAEAE